MKQFFLCLFTALWFLQLYADAPTSTVSYASAYTQAAQPLSDVETNPIEFFGDELTPVGIVHSGSDFTVSNDGVYLIGWTMSAEATNSNILEVNLFDVTLQELFLPSFFELFTLAENEAKAISGQALVPLSAGTKIQLIMLVNYPGTLIRNASIYIVQMK